MEKRESLTEESQDSEAPKEERRQAKKENEETTARSRHHYRRSHRLIESDWSEEDRGGVERRPATLIRKGGANEGRRKGGEESSDKEARRDTNIDSGRESEETSKERRAKIVKQLCHSFSTQVFLSSTKLHKHHHDKAAHNPLTSYVSFFYSFLFFYLSFLSDRINAITHSSWRCETNRPHRSLFGQKLLGCGTHRHQSFTCMFPSPSLFFSSYPRIFQLKICYVVCLFC